MDDDIPRNVIRAEGDIRDEHAFTNPVNLIGVMGRGLAKAVADRWPACVSPYRRALTSRRLGEGRVTAWERPDGGWVLQAPTKRHWRDPSPIELVTATIDAIGPACVKCGIDRIALPPLGCGLGGLDAADVLPHVLEAARRHPKLTWVLYRW